LICNFPTPQFPKDPIALIPFLIDSYRIHWVVGEVSRWVIANRLILNAKWRFVSRGQAPLAPISSVRRLIIEVFVWNVVFGDLVRMNFPLVEVRCFHAGNGFSLERVPFFE
jgi:hypothetical protein